MHPDKTKIHLENARLDSWKEIAAYLDRDERTAKRWEKTRGLPVHRLPGVRSGVFAFAREIDDWQKQGSASASSEAVAESVFSEAEFTPPTAEISEDTEVEEVTHESVALAAAGTRRPLLSYLHGHITSLWLLALIVACSLFLFTHRWGAHTLLPGLSPVRAGASAHVPSKDVEDLYLNGRYFWNKRTPAGLNTALGLFKQAVQRDPAYAPAYIGLADTYSLLVEYAALPPREAYPPAIAAAQRAILLDPSLPEAHRSLAFSSFYWSWDRSLSEKEFRTAIAIDPRDATTHHWFANTLMTSQRYQDALEEIEQARKLDPTAISILADRGQILSLVGREEESREALLQVEMVDPSFVPAHWYLAKTYHTGKNDRAYLNELRQVAEATHREADMAIYRAAAAGFATRGEQGMSDALAETQLKLYHRGLVPAFEVANAMAWSGKKKEAIQYLKLAYLSRDTQFLTLKRGDVLPMLKNDPEFVELAQKSGRPYREDAEIASTALGRDISLLEK